MKKTLKFLTDPIEIILDNRSEFFIWFLFTVIAGQIGIIANMIIRFYSYSASLKESILIDSNNGSFYTFSIALVASLLGPLFINLLNSKLLRFKTLKIYTIILSIFFLFFAGIVYAVIQSKIRYNNNQLNLSIDWTQFILYILAIGLVFYAYCILRLENDPIKYQDLDDQQYNEVDDKEVENRIEESLKLTEEGGVKL
jgi:hypothetical protein